LLNHHKINSVITKPPTFESPPNHPQIITKTP
jgi:hypothetical protein